jgi:hypothetical protein
MTQDGQNNDMLEQLMRLRHLTELTGALHEAQLLQFKMWTAVLFTKESTVEIKNERKDKDISYIIRGDVDNLKEKAKAVCEWTSRIVGDEWSIQVKLKGKRTKLVYRHGEVL